jgi:hypothetical protein
MAASAGAVQTQLTRTDTYDELAPGEMHGVSLSHLGRLTLGPELKRLYRADAEILWTLAVAPDGRVFIGSGHAGKIFVLDQKSSGSLFLDLHAPEVTALLFHSGKLYAGTSPDGKLLVCDKPGTATVVYATGEKYIWDLLADPAGNILVATGPKGKIFKVNPEKKKGELLFDAPDQNVLSLAYDSKGRLHAATQGKGRVYRWDSDRVTTPVVLFEAPDDEVRRIAIDKADNVFAAVNSEVQVGRGISAMPSGVPMPSPPRSEGPAGAEGPSRPEPARLPTPAMPPGPVGRSEVFLISHDGFVRSLWKVTEAPVHDVAYDAGRDSVVIAAGSKGKLFRLDTRANYWIVMSVEEEKVFALRPAGKQIYLATVGPTVAFRLEEALARKGEYLSPAINANTTVEWGRLRRDGDGLDDIKIETRSGNTKEPDTTWYDWREVKWDEGPRNGKTQSPVARYLQWRATFKAGRGGRSPELDTIEVFYVARNEAPQIRRIEIKKAGTPAPSRPPEMAGLPPQMAAAMAAAASTGSQPPSGKDFSVAENSNSKKFDITWQAVDPNNDPLESALYFKAEDEKNWMLIEEKLTPSKYTFDVSGVPDGMYRIKVVVSDKLANVVPNARTDELISDQFVVENTPPQIEKIKVTALGGANKGKWRISARATDAQSVLAAAKFNVDGGKWQVLTPKDGIFDDRTEDFEFDTDVLKGEEHVLGLIVTDREGNSTVGRAFLRP